MIGASFTLLLLASVIRMLQVWGKALPCAAIFAGGHTLFSLARGGGDFPWWLIGGAVEFGYVWLWFSLLARFDGTFAYWITLLVGIVLPVVISIALI